MTLKEALEKHYALWDSIAESGVTDKKLAPFWHDWDIDPMTITDRCFLCQYSIQEFKKAHPDASEKEDYCAFCPVLWGSNRAICADGSYHFWKHSDSLSERRYFAREIRDMPLKFWAKRILDNEGKI